MSFKKIDPKMNLPKTEEEVLVFWNEFKLFEKTLEKSKGDPLYTFYDGPPFATGTPHYGHIVASTMKDVVPRYWTMKGRYVPRKWGWDCHGLPIENIVEKELGYKSKKEIEKLGVEKFNALCRSKVLEYVEEWKKVINRLGRWADMENSYKTMDLSFMESVWWVFKELYDKGYIYEGYRSMHICPRCETTLSQSEVAEGYKTIKDLSAVAKFELIDEPGVYVLAWTTTPWTLIGNVALAIGEKMKYVEVLYNDKERYIFAKDLLDNIIPENDYSIISEFDGSDLIGKKYKPLFDYYSSNEELKNIDNGWKIYPADFVTVQEGTGVVHIAPAFGEDDMNLGKEKNLPFVQHVSMDGTIKKEAGEFAGMNVKPIEDHMKTDVEIIKNLASRNLLFKKEKYEHSYPHCWRCETPLINYATTSWFVAITKFKDEMIKLAEDINWSPSHIKVGRFGNWLESARDWSISRQRFWASVMPIWKCDKCNEIKVIGSVDEIREGFGNPNKLFLLRHGEAENNIKGIFSSSPEKINYKLSDKGKGEIEEITRELKNNNIEYIFSSPLARTKETAEIVAKKLGLEIIFDERLQETGMGEFNGKEKIKWDDIAKHQLSENNQYGIETHFEQRSRLENFINEINQEYQGKNIIIVSHGDPIRMMRGICNGMSIEETANQNYLSLGRFIVSYSKPVDLHKDVVDKITFGCEKCEGTMKRIPDVLDTWFDSGSMPYAELHYPFENKKEFEKGFPAEFIAEGIDQTRAWFYYLHAIASAIKDSRAFSNVVVNGIVLAEDGKKMAKRLQNYPDPMYVMDKYGSDVLRYYLLTSPVMQAENLNFKESELAELYRGMFRMLWNSYSFFVLYANIDKFEPEDKFEINEVINLLDKWIVSELLILIGEVNKNMENYELTRAARLFPKFIDNLSNWYIRRSRRRFWKSESDADKKEAYETLHYVLVTLAKLMAPFTPFIAEEIYKNLTGQESVHLDNFPDADEKLIDEKLNQEMSRAREIITEGLQLRAQAKIKVRQPLGKATLQYTVDEALLNIVKEELNVKAIGIDKNQKENIILDTEITEDLKLEGIAREIIRHIQEMRKEAGYQVDNRIKVCYTGWSEVFQKFGDLISKEILADSLEDKKLEHLDLQKEFRIEGQNVLISIDK
ncbi:MAG TPA: class I tRNA ligase family protein [Patescibacteria group bacterium]|nr:class I tRNA ligase family protein [Patescibacteria group bacterium]